MLPGKHCEMDVIGVPNSMSEKSETYQGQHLQRNG